MSVTVTQHPTSQAWYAKNTVPNLEMTVVDETITVQLYLFQCGTTLFEASYVPDFNGKVSVDLRSIYEGVMETFMPTADVTNQANASIYFGMTVDGSQSGPIANPVSGNLYFDFYVFNARLKSATPFQTWAGQNFLTNQPIEKTTNFEAKELLTYLDLVGNYNVIGRFYPKEGGLVDCIVHTDTGTGCFSVDVSYARLIPMVARLPHQLKGYYDIILCDVNLHEICRQRYIYEERNGKEKYFLFVNALGGIDTLICQGANVLQPETTHNIGRFGSQYKALNDTDDRRHWQQQTGLVPYRWRNWIHELLSSKQAVSKYEPETNTHHPIVIDGSEINMSDNGQLASATFGYMLSETDNVISDTERSADRSLHQSVADQAEALHDETVQVTLAFADDGNGGYETEDVTLAATKLYVEFEPTSEKTTVYYSIDGKLVGDFDPSEDTSPVIITKSADESIQFSSQDNVLDAVVVSYYPVTIQAV